MVDGLRRAVEDQVTRFKCLAGGDVGASVVLGLGDSGQGDAGGGVGSLRQAGAVEAGVTGGGAVAAPLVREAELALGVVDRFERRLAGSGLAPSPTALTYAWAWARTGRTGIRRSTDAGTGGDAGERAPDPDRWPSTVTTTQDVGLIL